MITLGLSAEDELLILQAQTLIFAIQNQSCLVESDPWEFGSLKIRCVIESVKVRGLSKPSWRKTWLINGHRIGFNALLGEIRKEKN